MKNDISQTVKNLVLEIEPESEIFLYGNSTKSPDAKAVHWDFLILVDGEVGTERADRIRHQLYSVESGNQITIKVIVKNREEWNNPDKKNIPLHKRISREGIAL